MPALADGIHISIQSRMCPPKLRGSFTNAQCSDAHPSNLDNIIFPGQDFNDARVFDFQNVSHWKLNKLDRTKNSRMGWSDLSICLQGPVVEDLGAHFVQRWNFIYDQKYCLDGNRYKPLSLGTSLTSDATYHPDGTNVHLGVASQKHAGLHAYAKVDDDTPTPSGAFPSGDNEPHQHKFKIPKGFLHNLHSRFRRGFSGSTRQRDISHASGAVNVQLTRSCSWWSNGTSLEVRINLIFLRKNDKFPMPSTNNTL
jgi:phospholipase D1/2